MKHTRDVTGCEAMQMKIKLTKKVLNSVVKIEMVQLYVLVIAKRNRRYSWCILYLNSEGMQWMHVFQQLYHILELVLV